MESFLNFAWVLLAIAIPCLWVRLERRTGAGCRLQFIALALLILILFPVISVSDDLQSLQNPAETDTSQCQRRDHMASCPHPIHPAVAAPPGPVLAEMARSFQHCAASLNLPAVAIDNPAFDSIQNRPPPTA
jgi:hypothetical protein